MIGTTILHYRISSKIGEGGMGEVYLATDTRGGSPVAIKLLSTERNEDEVSRHRFLHEARAQSLLDHPNLTRFIDSGEFEGRAYIVMEYIEGRSLDVYVESAKPRLSDTVDLLVQTAQGLAAAHEKGVVHRDIKPQNILVDAQGRVKITDFGLARLRDATTLTKTGMQMGTAHYMSPEQVEGRRVDHRSDIFSLGVLAYQLICGRKPFEGESTAAAAYQTVWEEPHPMARYTAGVPDRLQEIVSKCLAKSPTARYQSARELANDLEKIGKAIESGSAGSAHMPHVRRRKNLRRLGAALAIAGILVLSGIGLKYIGVRVEPTQEATAAIPSLAVVLFSNMTDPSDSLKTAQMAASLLTSGLSESRFLRVTSRQRVLELLGTMGKTDARELDRPTARALAQKAGVRWMVTGEVMQTSPRLVVSTEVTEIQSGEVATSQTISATPGEDVFALVDRISQAIRSGLPLPDSARTEVLPAVADVTTSSVEAYRYYLEGVDNSYEGRHQEARKSLRQAIAADSTFAMAHYEISRTWNSAEPTEMHEAIVNALRYSDHASRREQHLIRSRYYRFRGQKDSAYVQAKLLVENFPNDIDGHYVMAIMCAEFGRLDEVLEHGLRIVEIDSLDVRGFQIVRGAYDNFGDFENALRTVNRYLKHSTIDPAVLYTSRGNIYSCYDKSKEAIESYKQALSIRPNFFMALGSIGFMYLLDGKPDSAAASFQAVAADPDPKTRAYGRMLLPLIPFYQGRFARALEVIEEAIRADQFEGYSGIMTRHKREMKVAVLQAQKKYQEALAELAIVQSIEREFHPPVLVNFRGWEIELLLESGDSARALSLAAEIHQDIISKDTSASSMQESKDAAASIAYARGDFNEAIQLLEDFPMRVQFGSDYSSERFLLAKSYIRNRQLAEGTSYLKKVIGRRDEEARFDISKYVLSIYLLGTAYEQSGDRANAMEQYQTFLEIWKDADPGIPEVADARVRLDRLKRG